MSPPWPLRSPAATAQLPRRFATPVRSLAPALSSPRQAWRDANPAGIFDRYGDLSYDRSPYLSAVGDRIGIPSYGACYNFHLTPFDALGAERRDSQREI